MPEPDFFIKTGDTGSQIQWICEDSTGAAVDVAGSTPMFKMGPLSGGTLTIAGTATVDQVGAGTIDGTRGRMHFSWPTGGVSTADWYRAECEVTFMSGTIQTYPNAGFFLIAVTDDL
jgi:hypothetical protein